MGRYDDLTDEEWLRQLNILMGKSKRATPGKRGRNFKPLDEEGIIKLHNQGYSNRAIARQMFECSKTIDNRISKLRAEGRILD